MIDLFPVAKFRPPPAPVWPVSRPRLSVALEIPRPVVLVSAPPGSGKTTAVAAWLAAAPRPSAWLTLDEQDDDPARLGAALITAVQVGRDASAPAASALALALPPAPLRPVVLALLAELEAAGPFALILEDVHSVPHPEVQAALEFLIEHRPPQLRVVVTTRSDPEWPLARWRARGQLTELRAADLRFQPPEAAAFLAQADGLALTPAETARLTERTEGWIAGLQLAALALRGHTSAAAFSGAHPFVADYLVSDVLRAQPPARQRFLLRTALLERLCGPLCEAVAGADPARPAAAELEALERANLFLTPLDAERRWYRYHRLFAEALRARLAAETLAGERAQLHRRAAAWLAANGHPAEAVDHIVAAAALDADWEAAAAGLAAEAEAAFQRGELARLRGWVRALPAWAADRWPAVRLLRARLELAAGQVDRAWLEVQAAEAAGAGAQLPAELAVMRAFIASRQLDPQAIPLQEQALRGLPEAAVLPRGLLHTNLGYVYWLLGDMPAAGRHAEAALALCRMAAGPVALLAALVTLAMVREMQGRLDEAEALAREALTLGGVDGKPWPVAGLASASIALGRVLFERGEFAAAEAALRRGTALAETLAAPLETWFGYMNLARLRRARGDAAGALEALALAEQAGVPAAGPQAGPQTRALRALVWIGAGRAEAAADYIDTTYAALLRQAEPLAPDIMREYELIVLAEALIGLGRPAAARQLAGRLKPAAEQGGRVHSLIRLHLAAAAGWVAAGDRRAALEEARAQQLAAPGRYQAPFLEAALTRRLALPPSADLPEPLTPRELEVLRLIGAGLSNREAAQQLVVAPETIKVHLKHIYAKLDVRDRRAAVARGRALRLL